MEDHAGKAVDAAVASDARQTKVNDRWRDEATFLRPRHRDNEPRAAALLGSDEHLEYTVVGDTVNLAQRLSNGRARARSC